MKTTNHSHSNDDPAQENPPTIKQNHRKKSNILAIDSNIKDFSVDKPIISYRGNRDLKDFLGSNTIENNIKVTRELRTEKKNMIRKCKPCFSKESNLCGKQRSMTS